MDMCYIKKKPLTKNKAEAYYLNVYASEYSYNHYLGLWVKQQSFDKARFFQRIE